jgi:hypothetical protein
MRSAERRMAGRRWLTEIVVGLGSCSTSGWADGKGGGVMDGDLAGWFMAVHVLTLAMSERGPTLEEIDSQTLPRLRFFLLEIVGL